jgi:DnaJ-class molecular chaperone
MADPYATLGVARGADEKAIKSAYRKLAKELHPDRNKDNPKAAERFSDVTRAYDLLSDKDKRAQFDRGEIDGDGNPANPFAGMGGGFGGGGFGGQQRRQAPPPKGADIAYRLRVPFVDAARRADQRITLADGKTIDLKLPAGVEDGTQMRLKGKGQQGPGGAGDGIVTISVDGHAFFRREGDNVRLDLPITLDEAIAGAKIKVPTVDGPVMLTIKPGTSSGTTMRLGGKGFSKKAGGRGDQLVTLEIDLPDDVAELAKRLEGWQDTRNPRSKLGV